MKRLLIGCLMVFLLVGCGGREADEGVYEGFLAFGFETSSFVPCATEENWWVIPNQQTSDGYTAVSQQPYQAVFARLKGDVSEVGTFGHLGQYNREFTIREVVEIRPAGAEDCQ